MQRGSQLRPPAPPASRCLQPKEGRILDTASPALAEVREARRANRAALRAEMDRWARQLHQAGVSERAQVVVRRDRLCVPVRRGRQGELPKGSVTLAASESGNTLYMEPKVGGWAAWCACACVLLSSGAPAVAARPFHQASQYLHPLATTLQPAVSMNNAEMALAGREVEEETAVLRELTGLLAQHAQRLCALLAGVTALDVASARARHASWLGATTPPRFLTQDEAAAGGPVQLPRAWHPLLLQSCLAPLPSPPLPPDAAQQLEEELRWAAEAEVLLRCCCVRGPCQCASRAAHHARLPTTSRPTLAHMQRPPGRPVFDP